MYENPSTEFVASFLGASNLLEGELKDGSSNGEAALIETATGTVLVPFPRLTDVIDCVAFSPDS